MFVIFVETWDPEMEVSVRKIYGPPFGTRAEGNKALEKRGFTREPASIIFEKNEVFARVEEIQDISKIKRDFFS